MNGHMGARKFWKNYLPTLKFYNIDLPMEVVRIENKDKNKEIPCILEIQDKSLNKEIAKLDMRNLRDTEIAEKLVNSVLHFPFCLRSSPVYTYDNINSFCANLD